MEQSRIDKMVAQNRVVLTKEQAFWHFSVVWFILLMPAISLFDLIKNYFVPAYNANHVRDLTTTNIYFLIAAVISYLIQRYKLRFHTYSIACSDEELEQALKVTVQVDKWDIRTHQKQIIQAFHTDSLWGGLEAGEMITIIKQKGRILINSISDPQPRGKSPFTRQHKRNIATFLENIRSVTNHIPQKMATTPSPEREWTLKKIITRLVMYPVCITLIVIGVSLIIEVGHKAAIRSIICITAACIYLYSDIKIITKRATSTSEC